MTPFRSGPLENLSVAGAIGHGRREGERFFAGRTSSRSVVFFDQLPLNGSLDRYNFEGWWFYKSMKVQAEYMWARGEREILPDVEADGYYVQATYVLTGETKGGNDAIVPKRPVHEGGWGAFEVGARYQAFEVRDFNRATDLTLGVTWWLNPFLRLQANPELEEFRRPPDPATGETSNLAFVSRWSLYF